MQLDAGLAEQLKRHAGYGLYRYVVALASTPLDPDFDLVRRWRAGEAAAGELLFARHFQSLYRFFRHKCGADADELVQTTLLACIGARDQYRGDASFRTYMFAIARQKLHRYFATRVPFDPLVSSVADVVTSIRTELARDQANDALVGALQQLPLELQTLLELHYWEGLDTVELAQIHEVPPGTIRVWMHRARAKLRTLLEPIVAC